MNSPLTRKEYERNIYILAETINSGNFNISKDFKSFKSLLYVRNLPNKRVNLNTVDESVRNIASTVSFMQKIESNATKK